MIIFSIILPFIGTLLGTFPIVFSPIKFTGHRQSDLNTAAAGIMCAAAVWSLLIPSIRLSPEEIKWLPAVTGLLIGAFTVCLIERLLSKHRPQKSGMLYLAVTLHNFPEGMAVGAALAGMACTGNISLSAAILLSLGIAIQNIPEGAIVYAPLLAEGKTKGYALFLSIFSGLVEPIGAVMMFFFAGMFSPILPYVLSFSAGAMLYVIADELIPNNHNRYSAVIFCIGFSLMMFLDVAFG